MSSFFFRVEGSGQPVILIHGFCETSDIWNEFSPLLADSYQVFSIDLPGFGKSALPSESFTIDDIARLVIKWIVDNKIENPILIGHSLGGYVTLSMCELAPEKIKGFVLFHSTAYPDTDEKKANRNKVIEFVKTHGVDPFIDTFVPSLFKDKDHPAIPKAYKIARPTLLRTLIAYSTAMRDRPSRVDFLKSFSKPFLVIGGKWDSIVPTDISKELGRSGKKSKTVILSDAAHIGMLEQPSEAAMALKEFIASTDR